MEQKKIPEEIYLKKKNGRIFHKFDEKLWPTDHSQTVENKNKNKKRILVTTREKRQLHREEWWSRTVNMSLEQLWPEDIGIFKALKRNK